MSTDKKTPQGNHVMGGPSITPPSTGIIDILSGGTVTTGPSVTVSNLQASYIRNNYPNPYIPMSSSSVGNSNVYSNIRVDTGSLRIVHEDDMNKPKVFVSPLNVMVDAQVAQSILPPSKWAESVDDRSYSVYPSRVDPFQEIVNNHGAFEKRIHRGDARCLETAFQYYLTGHSVRVLVGSDFMFEDEGEIFFPPIELLFDSLLTEEPKIKVPAPFAQLSNEVKVNEVNLLRNGFEYRKVDEAFTFDQVNEYLRPPVEGGTSGVRVRDPHSRSHNSWTPISTKCPARMQVFEGPFRNDVLGPTATLSLFNNETSAQNNLEHFKQDGFLYFVAPSTFSQHITSTVMALMCRYDGEKSDNNLWS